MGSDVPETALLECTQMRRDDEANNCKINSSNLDHIYTLFKLCIGPSWHQASWSILVYV